MNYEREWTKDWSKKLLPVGSTEEIQLQNEDGSFKSSGEIATLIMESVVSDKKEWLEAVNVPNKGAIPNLPDDLVVEVPAYSDASGIHPVKCKLFQKVLQQPYVCMQVYTSFWLKPTNDLRINSCKPF